ncbi:CvfB family protein [Virgibacillus sp. MG-45]|uniref:CvfB family protein n=1 Tax=Virgibacillus sp. MG-45 TaxID=3102791 RepID=UPI002ED93C8A
MVLAIGTIETMQVDRLIENGYVLQKDLDEALLHHNEATKPLETGEEVKVFLYHDKKGNITATMSLPVISIDQYGWAEVVESKQNLGVFVSIGTTKDFLVSKDDLPLFEDVWPQAGDQLYVTLGKDRKGRLLALPATEGVINGIREWAAEEYLNKQVTGHVYRTSREGTAIITDEGYRGFIHHSERKTEPRLGEKIQGRVIDVKIDGTLNVTLRPLKQDSLDEDAAIILNHLQEHDGVIPFTDKSDPEDIRATFQMSKAAFKRALGRLMKQKLVEQRDDSTWLL